jgi:hypothetical protein
MHAYVSKTRTRHSSGDFIIPLKAGLHRKSIQKIPTLVLIMFPPSEKIRSHAAAQREGMFDKIYCTELSFGYMIFDLV